MELTQLLVDYQKRLRESSDSQQASEDNLRKLSMEVDIIPSLYSQEHINNEQGTSYVIYGQVSILKHEKEILVNSEKRALDEVRSLIERVHRLQVICCHLFVFQLGFNFFYLSSLGLIASTCIIPLFSAAFVALLHKHGDKCYVIDNIGVSYISVYILVKSCPLVV